MKKAHKNQLGMTLIELMVGIAVGLLVVAVAMGALMVSRGVSGTVSDASSIQQQGAYVMRVIGLQVRQAGSLRLNLNPSNTKTADLYMTPAAFETFSVTPSSLPSTPMDNPKETISGADSPPTLVTGYRRYTEPVFASATEQTLSKNCLGGPSEIINDQRVSSTFIFDSSKNILNCKGNDTGAASSTQPIAQNVANFQVSYLMQDNTNPGIPKITALSASAISNWAQVQAVQVCIVLYGTEAINLPTDGSATYTDCNNSSVDMTTLTGDRKNRMHIAFKNTFQLRSQGLISQAL